MEYRASYVDSLRADILPSYTDSLTHHGILGQRWGIRRFQKRDGTLTPSGKKRYDAPSQPKKAPTTPTKKKQRKPKKDPFRIRQNFMENAMREVFGEDTKIDYMNIYKEMSKDKRFKNLLDSDDNDDYKQAEAAWLMKHDLYDAYVKAFEN